jgi:hypothetical protein
MNSLATSFGHEFCLGVAVWPDRTRIIPHAAKGRKIGNSVPLGRTSRNIWHPELPGDFISDPQSSGYATEVSRAADTKSHPSGGSQEFIIRKSVTMTVNRGQGVGRSCDCR